MANAYGWSRITMRQRADREAIQSRVNWRRVVALTLNTAVWAGLIWVLVRIFAKHP